MRQANFSDKSLIIDMLAKAFDDNKSVNYIVRQDNNRAERIKGLLEYSYKVCEKFGEVWISDDLKPAP